MTLGYICWAEFPGGPELISQKTYSTREEAISAARNAFREENFVNEDDWIGIDYVEDDDGFISVIEKTNPKYGLALGMGYDGYRLVER